MFYLQIGTFLQTSSAINFQKEITNNKYVKTIEQQRERVATEGMDQISTDLDIYEIKQCTLNIYSENFTL